MLEKNTNISKRLSKCALSFFIGLLLFSISIGCRNPFDTESIKATITGRITDKQNKPVQDAFVFTDPPTKTEKTNSEGRYAITNILAGSYKLKASKPGYATGINNLEVKESWYACESGTIYKDMVLTQQNEVERMGEIFGNVKDTNGNDIKDAKIFTEPATSEIKTDRNGIFVITNINAGTYVLKVSKDKYKDEMKGGVVVESGKRTEIEIMISPINPGKVKGQIKFLDGVGIEGVEVETNPATSRKITDLNGNYEIIDIIPGDYTIMAVVRRQGSDMIELQIKEITVKSGETANGDIIMPF